MLCKEERTRLRAELAEMGALGRRQACNRERLAAIRRELAELSNETLAEKFGLTEWAISRL